MRLNIAIALAATGVVLVLVGGANMIDVLVTLGLGFATFTAGLMVGWETPEEKG